MRKYKRLALEKGLHETLFRKLTDKLLKAFDVNADKQRLDSTHIVSNMKNLQERGLGEKYLKKNSERYFGEVKPSESRKTLKELAEDLWENGGDVQNQEWEEIEVGNTAFEGESRGVSGSL